MTVEEKALIWARRQKGNILNNKNVDCFIAGYNMAAKEYREIIDKGHKEVLRNGLTIVDLCTPIQIGLLGKNQHIMH